MEPPKMAMRCRSGDLSRPREVASYTANLEWKNIFWHTHLWNLWKPPNCQSLIQFGPGKLRDPWNLGPTEVGLSSVSQPKSSSWKGTHRTCGTNKWAVDSDVQDITIFWYILIIPKILNSQSTGVDRSQLTWKWTSSRLVKQQTEMGHSWSLSGPLDF